MYSGSPFFVRFGRYSNRISSFANGFGGWLLIAPGLSLIMMGLAIWLWPELLAYMVAGLLLFMGTALALWGWRMNQSQKHMRRRMGNGFYSSEVRHPFEQR